MPRVILWTSHRCASTVFERSMRELETVKVIHEPQCMAYFCDDGTIRDGDDADAKFVAKREHILSLARQTEQYKHAFVKDMAYFIIGRYEEYVQGEFAHFKHTFLIRHPMSVALSFQKVMKAHQTRVPFFTETLGFEELDRAYEVVKSSIDENPIIVSAEDLLSQPREMLQMYCRDTGLPYSDSMLTWEPKVFPEWKQYPQYELWFQSVMHSRGFLKQHVEKQSRGDSVELLPGLQEAIDRAMPYYEKLNKLRRTP